MHRANLNLSGATQTITKTHNSTKVPATNSMVIKKWVNVESFDKRFTHPPEVKPKPKSKPQPTHTPLNKIYLGTNPIKGQTEQKIMQNTLNKIDLRAASQTVDNSMDTDADLLLGIKEVRETTLPNFNHFKSILNDEQSLSNIDQTSPPSCAEILGKNSDNYLLPGVNQILWDTCEEHNEDAVPPIHCMLPPEYI